MYEFQFDYHPINEMQQQHYFDMCQNIHVCIRLRTERIAALNSVFVI